MRLADRGESGSDDKFYDAQVDVKNQVIEKISAWWLRIGANRRIDEEVNNEGTPDENEEVGNEEVNQENNQEGNFEWESMHEDAKLQGESQEKQADKDADSGSGEKFFDAVDEERPAAEDVTTPDVDVPAPVIPKAPTALYSMQALK
ncbi:hypothetical protein Dimus_024126 [Dionaea muscipula]